MSVAVGYGNFGQYIATTQQMYVTMRRSLSSVDLKFGGFDYQPVIWKIPSGYAKTGAYIRQLGSDKSNLSNSLYVGLLDFDTLGDRVESDDFVLTGAAIMFAYGDTKEFVVFGSQDILALELLDVNTLSGVGYMIWPSGINVGVFCDASGVYVGTISIINAEPIRSGDNVKVSRVYFSTPLGLVTTRRLYAMSHWSLKYNLCVQVGTSKFISVGDYLVDVTDEV